MSRCTFSRRALLAAATLALAAGLAAVAYVGAEEAASVSKPKMTAWMVFVETDGKIGIGFQFDVKDAEAVEENRNLALTLLPNAIAEAEAKNAQWFVLRASQKLGIKGGMQMFKYYGYVWKKDPMSGAWLPKTP